jgi:UDP-N-acetylmuramate dehydrogenase
MTTDLLHRLADHFRKKYPDTVKINEPLENHTTYRVGGPAMVFCSPDNRDELQEILQACAKAGAPVFILGSGSNILVNDAPLEMVVIQLRNCCNELFHQGNVLYAGAGILVSELVDYCEAHDLAGLDYMSGIPGTVGGALLMNAGAFVGEIGDRVNYIDAMMEDGKMRKISKNEAGFGYRRADFLQDKIILGCSLLMLPGNRTDLAKSREDYLTKRAAKQPLEYGSCGSVFKRPPNNYAGSLIEQAGCKGMRVGGAMVSPKHANFFVNYDNASASDIYQLIKEVQKIVYEKFQIWLEPEVKLVGFSDDEKNALQKYA